jgi:hypothetical protein
MSPSVAAGFDRWPERDDWKADRPMRAAPTGPDASPLEGGPETPGRAYPAHVPRTGTRRVPSSIARFSTSRSSANARPETSVRWPEDLSDQWPELPDDPARPADRSAEEQIRMSERFRRLDAEQRGTRWNA